MAYSILLTFDATSPVFGFPPGAILQQVMTVQAATAEEMTAGVKKLLSDVQAQNVGIAANPDLGDEFKLTLNDAVLSGAGDGHTFVLTLWFCPAIILDGLLPINGLLFFLLALVGSSTIDLSPENFSFAFSLASDAAHLQALQPGLQKELTDIAATNTGTPIAIGVFNLSAGSAKGTRFMYGIGAITNQPETTLVAVDTTNTVPATRSFFSKLASLKKPVPVPSPAPATAPSAASSSGVLATGLGTRRRIVR